jgi:hypothetical protein
MTKFNRDVITGKI